MAWKSNPCTNCFTEHHWIFIRWKVHVRWKYWFMRQSKGNENFHLLQSACVPSEVTQSSSHKRPYLRTGRWKVSPVRTVTLMLTGNRLQLRHRKVDCREKLSRVVSEKKFHLYQNHFAGAWRLFVGWVISIAALLGDDWFTLPSYT